MLLVPLLAPCFRRASVFCQLSMRDVLAILQVLSPPSRRDNNMVTYQSISGATCFLFEDFKPSVYKVRYSSGADATIHWSMSYSSSGE